MRLLHTTDFYFQEWNNPRRYAILSHRWGDGEVSFQDFQQRRVSGDRGQGMLKILNFCKQAKQRDFDWVWIDTCCIDKTSSAELSEAINSMFDWYRDSNVCIVYLHDISQVHYIPDQNHTKKRLSPDSAATLRRSEWFGRGWTLQELLAPSNVTFVDLHWREFGSKWSLAPFLSEITGIGEAILQPLGRGPLNNASIATKMSWASNRKTTKQEDLAYSMLGLFDVNMPLLYGEGSAKAFMRLQLEILKKSSDESIFAWVGWGGGLLSRYPGAFSQSGHIVSFPVDVHQRLPYNMTNQGLELRAPLGTILDVPKETEDSFLPCQQNQIANPRQKGTVKVYLACGHAGHDSSKSRTHAKEHAMCITLASRDGQWERVNAGAFEFSEGDPFQESVKSLTFYIPQKGL